MIWLDEINMYDGVGRMGILQSKEVIPSQWLEKQKLVDKITGLEQRESNLERSIREAELIIPPWRG